MPDIKKCCNFDSGIIFIDTTKKGNQPNTKTNLKIIGVIPKPKKIDQ